MKIKTKKDIMYECDICGKQATLNLQNVCKLYSIIDDDRFKDRDEWEGDSNEFFCDKCYEKENN